MLYDNSANGLKKNVSRNGLSPIMGRIAVGKNMVQFSCKLEADSTFGDARAGRLNGKSHHARLVNSEIDKINVAVNVRYKEIVSIRGKATAGDVKNAFQGIASSQETLLKVFREHNDLHFCIGGDYMRRCGFIVYEQS